jgi:YD repeat-containing protein
MSFLRASIATGETVLRRTDLRLPGYIPITLVRVYRSGQEHSGEFGYGWRLNWALDLRAESDEITYAAGMPHEVTFTPVEEGMQARHATGTLLQHLPQTYVVVPMPSRRLVFEKEDAQDGTFPLSRVEDPNENAIHFFYDRGRIAGIVDTMGREIRFDYQGGQVTRLYVDGGNGSASTVRTFRYNGQGDLVEEVDAEGQAASFGYQHHLMTEYTVRDGGTQYAQYDEDQRCRALWYADESDVRRVAYDARRQVTRVTNGEGRQTLYQHVQPGQVLERTDPADQSQNYYYDETRSLIGFSDEYEAVQTFQQLNFEGQEATLLEAEERGAFLELNEDLRATSVRDPLDRQHALIYGDQDQPIEYRTPSGRRWTFQRDDQGIVTEVTSPAGRSVRLTYTPEDRRLVVENDLGRRTEEHFDEFGRLVERVDPLGRRFQWRYDANNRLLSVHAGRQSIEFGYSPGGSLSRIVGDTGQTTEMTRDAFGRLQGLGVGEERYQVRHNAAGRASTVSGPAGDTNLEYEAGGRLAEVAHARGHFVTYGYTEEGTEVVTDGPDGKVRSVYNQAGDPVRWRKPEGREHRLEYGPSGELLSVEWGDQSLFFDYDDEGCLIEATDLEGGRTLQLEYDALGRVQAVSRNGDRVVECERDSYGRPTELKGLAQDLELTYDAGDRVRELRGGDRSWTFEYDAFDRLLNVQGDRGRDGEIPDRVRTDTLLSGGSDEQERTAVVRLHMAQRGVALSLHTDQWCVPMWQQSDCSPPECHVSSGLIAAALILGEEPLIDPLRPLFPPRLAACWQRGVMRGVRWDYTDIPGASTLKRVGWAGLDRFFLNRSFYEMGHLSLLPDEQAHPSRRRERSPDPWVTGSHIEGGLRPPIWTREAAGPHLCHRALGPDPGSTGALDILEFIRKVEIWN